MRRTDSGEKVQVLGWCGCVVTVTDVPGPRRDQDRPLDGRAVCRHDRATRWDGLPATVGAQTDGRSDAPNLLGTVLFS